MRKRCDDGTRGPSERDLEIVRAGLEDKGKDHEPKNAGGL